MPKPLLQPAIALSLLVLWPLAGLGFPAEVERSSDLLTVTWQSPGAAPVDVWVEYRDDSGQPRRQLLSPQDADGRHSVAAEAQRPYFVLTTAEGDEQVVAERLLPLQGGNNFRDLGGYETADGRTVQWGVLYRSGTMVQLTPDDYRYLGQLGIRTICDFRSSEERSNEPTDWLADPQPVRQQRDYVLDTTTLMASIARPDVTPEQAKAVFADFYREVPFVYAEHYRTLFAELLAGRAPLTFNCSAGKDRTGVAAALLLSALGVERQQVVADYLLSNRYYKPAQPKPGANDSTSRLLASLQPAVVQVLMGVDASYIEAALDAATRKHGSLEAYFANELGVDAAGLRQLRDLYTD
jgi:protein-tyrosine phosphatase